MVAPIPSQLILMRHGPAMDRDDFGGDDDRLRPLTEPGKKVTQAAARFLADHGSPEIILCSDLVRARETAEIVRDALRRLHAKAPELMITTALRPEASWQSWLSFLKSDALRKYSNQCWLAVGHQPSISYFLAAHMGDSQPWAGFKKAGFAVLKPKAGLDYCQLLAYITPKFLQGPDESGDRT